MEYPALHSSWWRLGHDMSTRLLDQNSRPATSPAPTQDDKDTLDVERSVTCLWLQCGWSLRGAC
jgi:hypothetical protein